MPRSRRDVNERSWGDFTSRTWADRMFMLVYMVGTYAVAAAALGVCIYALTVSFGEAARALIFFLVPSAWGAYVLATRDGEPEAILKLSDSIATGLAVVTAMVIGAVWIISAPVSIVNLALGALEAFFFLLKISGQTSRHRRRYTAAERVIVRALLIMFTLISVFVAVSVH